MKKIHRFLLPVFFLLVALFLSATRMFFKSIPEFSFRHHSLSLEILPFAGWGLLGLALLLAFWTGWSFLVSRALSVDFSRSLAHDALTYTPFLFLALLPLTLSHYLDSQDLAARAAIYLWGILAGFVYLKGVVSIRLDRQGRRLLPALGDRFFSLPLKKKLLILFATALVVYNGGSALMTASGQTFSGDEPHYLLIAHSLLQDGDFNLADNYAQRDYTKIMQAQVKIRPHTAPGTGGRYSFHSPGTALLLLPIYGLASLFGGPLQVILIRAGMSLFGALLGIQVFRFVLKEWKNEKVALGVWGLYSFTSPVFFYSLHVYPEIIVALASVSAFYLLRFSSSWSRARLVWLGVLIASPIWFHALKYLPIIAPFFLYALWTLGRKQDIRRTWPYLLLGFGGMLLTYFFFQFWLYRSLSLSSISWRGAMTFQESLSYLKTVWTDIPFRTRWETLAGYLLDQRDGLLPYAPVYLLALLGIVALFRRNSPYAFLILFLSVPYVLNSAWLTQRTGYAPPARPLVAVSWALALFLGAFLVHNAKTLFSILLGILACLSFAVEGLLLAHPLALYQLTTAGVSERAGHLFLMLSGIHVLLPRYLPSFLKIDNSGWVPNYIWPACVFLIIGLDLIVRKHRWRIPLAFHPILVSTAIGVLFLWLVLYPRPHLLYPHKVTYPSGQKVTFYGLGRVAQMVEPGKFHLPRDGRDYTFYFTSWRPFEEIQVDFGSPHGSFAAKLELFDLPLYEGTVVSSVESIRIPSPPFYRYKNSHLYRLRITLEKKAGVIAFSHPFLFVIRPLR